MSDEPLRVLHVDDEYLWRSVVSDYLISFGNYHITSAESGDEVISYLKNTSFDIIISDFQMPKMNGIELLRYIRRHGDTIPFILFTGIKRDDIEERAKESGADFYIVKTGDPDLLFSELSQKIQEAVARHKTVQSLLIHKENEITSSLP